MKYIIISLKWTHKNDSLITFWRDNANGYCWFKDWIGLYSYVTASNRSSSHTKIIPAKRLDSLWQKIDYEGKIRRVIPNTPEVREALGIKKSELIRTYPSAISKYKVLEEVEANAN